MQERTSPDWPNGEDWSSRSAIPPAEVQAQLSKILASGGFRNAPRHSRFLSFVVNKALSGRGGGVKEYLIGLEVFDRTPDFDPTSDPVVRSEARRLRFRLADYYREPGRLDPIHIDLPKGTYVPVFYRNGVEPALEQAVPETHSVASATGRRAGLTRKSLIVLVAAIAALGLAVFILIRTLTADRRPAAGRLEGSTLIITNSKGEELWRKSFPDGFLRDYYEKGLATRMWFGELDGKGHSDVLLAYHPAVKPTAHSTILICYSNHGKEKWRWTPGRALPELEGDPATFGITGLGVLKAVPGQSSRIVVSSSHALWYPSQIAILDSNGKLISEYWHSGHLDHLTLADLDGEGREDIIATGISNGYRQATLIVLDPDRVFGASTEAARPEIQIHGMGTARERIRLLFRRSDLNTALDSYNEGQEVTVGHNGIRFSTLECRQRAWGCPIVYEFDTRFRLLSVYADDSFRGFHNEFYRQDKRPHLFNAEEENEFQKVRCLVGCNTEYASVQNH